MKSQTIYSEALLLDKLYSDELFAKIEAKYLGFNISVNLRLLDEKKSPDCYIEDKVYQIAIRTEKGTRSEKYESIEELKKDCYHQLKTKGIEPKQIIVSNLMEKCIIPFNNEQTSFQFIQIQQVEDEVIVMNYGIKKLTSQSLLLIPKGFAEKNLSKEVISLAKQTSEDYLWELSTTAYPVFFELPRIFNVIFQEVLRGLIMYNMDYLRINNLNDNIIYKIFLENQEKTINA